MGETNKDNQAQFKYRLIAESGYEAWGDALITAEQYGRIMQIINEPTAQPVSLDAAALMAERLESMDLQTCREAAALIRQLSTQTTVWSAQFLHVQSVIERLDAKPITICKEAARMLRQLAPPA